MAMLRVGSAVYTINAFPPAPWFSDRWWGEYAFPYISGAVLQFALQVDLIRLICVCRRYDTYQCRNHQYGDGVSDR